MKSWTLGSDPYFAFTVKVGNLHAIINNTMGELYHQDGSYIRDFVSRHSGSKVSGTIDGKAFSTVGSYIAKFNVILSDMGKQEYAIPFRITKSVLGKKAVRNRG